MNKSIGKSHKVLKLFGYTVFEWYSNKIAAYHNGKKIYYDETITENDYKILEKYRKANKNDNDYWWK